MVWTDEMDSMIKTLWRGGLSAAQIFETTGYQSRSAICGRLARLGERREGVNVLGQRKLVTRVIRIPRVPPPSRPPSPSLVMETVADIAHPYKTMDANAVAPYPPGTGWCKWIIGEVGKAYAHCAKPALEDLPYCQSHAARAYKIKAPIPDKAKAA